MKGKPKEKICGNCKYVIPHRRDRFGFDANCKEMVIKSGQTAIIDLVHIDRQYKGCEFFEFKEK